MRLIGKATLVLAASTKLFLVGASGVETCDDLMNSALLFVKPHANTPATKKLVRSALTEAGISILSETEINGEVIDKKGLIDQHYYSIASKATLLEASAIPVPEDKFENAFGESWDQVLKEGRACNAMEACRRFDCSPSELNTAWRKVKAHKFGGGFYCGRFSVNGKPELYVFNAFFMEMRSQFVGKENSIHCYVVQWDPARIRWSTFRDSILGQTDPATAPVGSIRRTIFDEYRELGLRETPNTGANGVHGSASPFEGLAEKVNWLSSSIKDDPFGQSLLEAGIPEERLLSWFKDPQVNLGQEQSGSIFDVLEETDAGDCLRKLLELNAHN